MTKDTVNVPPEKLDVEELTRRVLAAFTLLREAMAKDGIEIEMHLSVKGPKS